MSKKLPQMVRESNRGVTTKYTGCSKSGQVMPYDFSEDVPIATHVIKRVANGWAVKKSGASRAAGVYKTQKEAISHAREIAKKSQGDLYIHGKDGTIREKDSYGQDPRPPRYKK